MLLGTTTMRRVPARTRHTRIPRYVVGPKPKRRTELGLLVFASVITVALYIIAETAHKSKIPPHIGPFLGIVLGLSLAAHMANRWLAPQGNAVILPLAATAQRDRLRRHRPLGPRVRQIPGRLGGHRRRPVCRHTAGGAVLTGPREVPLPPALGGRPPAGRPPVLHADQRREAVDPLLELRVPAGRVLQNSPLHLLRLVLRLQQGTALHTDGADREPARARPPSAHPDSRGLGGRHGDHRVGGRHRIRRAALRALHRLTVDHHRPRRLPGVRLRPVRRRCHLRRALFQPGALQGRTVAQPMADQSQSRPHPARRHAVRLGRWRHRGNRSGTVPLPVPDSRDHQRPDLRRHRYRIGA